MGAQVTNYKCPACTGPLHFVGESGKLECDYCGSTFDVEVVEQLMAAEEAKAKAEFNAANAPHDEWDTSHIEQNWTPEGMKAYSCPSCGAELICDETTAATSCPYCGNPTIVPGQLTGALKPDLVIPFKLAKEDAVAALKKHYQGKLFLPKAFSDQNHVEEVKGVYVPFWLFDGVADANVEFNATRSHERREGNYEVTTTEHFRVFRSGTLAFENVPVDGSTQMPDGHMDAIEPYDYSELKPFSTAYLPGFLADKYDVTAEDSAERADRRCENSIVETLRETVTGYMTVTTLSENVQLTRGRVKYALMPVWLLSTKWKDKNYLFAMNGQTGKLVGDLPIDKAKMWGIFAAIAAVVGGVLSFFFGHY